MNARRPIARFIHSMSLGARIVWVFVLTAIFAILLFGAGFHLLTQGDDGGSFPRLVADYSDMLLEELGQPASHERALAIASRTGLDIAIERGAETWFSAPKALEDNGLDLQRLDFRRHQAGNKSYAFHRGIAVLRVERDDDTVWFVVSLRRNPAMGLAIFTGFIALLVFWIYLAYRMVRYLIHPIRDIQAGVERFSGGDLGWRIPVRREDDLGELTADINRMAGQIQQMLESKRQLLLAISHELRTPLTRLNIALDLPDSEANRAKMKNAAKQMERLTGELIESEKLSASHSALNLEAVDLDRLLRELIDQEFTDHPAIQIRLGGAGYRIEADVMRIRLLFRNLIDNAIKYGGDGDIIVHTEKTGERLLTRIIDHGEGIDADSLPHVFDPFYREDKARQRQTGGSGLGLYLAKRIVEAHGGAIALHSEKGKGTEVAVSL